MVTILFKMNAITSFVDASQIYGSDDETARKLRTFSRGQLKSSFTAGRRHEMLPNIDGTFTVNVNTKMRT